MAKGIDFLQAQKEKRREEEKVLVHIKIGSIIFLVVYCLLVGATFSFWVYLNQDYRNVSRQIVSKKQRIEQLRRVESLQIILKQRVFHLEKLFSYKAPDYSQILSYLEKISPAGVSLTEVELLENGEGKLSGIAPNALVVSNFLKELTSDTSTSPFSKIVLSSARRQKDGTYNFTLSFNANGKS